MSANANAKSYGKKENEENAKNGENVDGNMKKVYGNMKKATAKNVKHEQNEKDVEELLIEKSPIEESQTWKS